MSTEYKKDAARRSSRRLQRFVRADFMGLARHVSRTHPVLSEKTELATTGTAKTRIFLVAEACCGARHLKTSVYLVLCEESNTAAPRHNGHTGKRAAGSFRNQRRHSPHRANAAKKVRHS